MEFIKKTELFFIQLQYCLTIEVEPVLQAENGNYDLMLKPDIFFKLINDYQIEYPFIPQNKIIELKVLMRKENINTKDALKIIENYKKQYWSLDIVIMFEPVIDKLKRTLKSIDINISEKEINIEFINYQKHLQAKRESIYTDLINEILSLPPQQTGTKTNKLKAPVLGLFCSLIHKIGIDKKDETESATVYCERICGKFKLPYTDRVRQNYNVNETKKLIQELTEKVLPLIDNETKNSVEKYLDSKQLPKQNLYG